MSHARVTGQDPGSVPPEPYERLARMIGQGRSFSSHERNCCFLNLRQGDFATVSATSGLDFPDDGRAIALVDWDHDGDLDLWIANRNAPRLRLMRNNTPVTSNWVELQLVGNGKTTNRDAIGARVEIVTDAAARAPLMRTVRAGEGFLAQSSKWIHFGLSDDVTIEKVVVRWPGGGKEEFSGVTAGGRHRLVQGAGQAESVQKVRGKVNLVARAQSPLPDTEQARIPLTTQLPVPALPYESFDGTPAVIPSRAGAGKPVWVVLWASWCRPCLDELGEITAGENELRSAGIDVVALSVNGLGADGSDPKEASAFIERIGFPFSSGRATATILQTFQALHDLQIPLQRSMPLPSSFLIDGEGKLVALYKGPATINDVISDLQHADDTWQQRFVRAAPLPGRVINDAGFERLAAGRDTKMRFRYAKVLAKMGTLDDAARLYTEVIRIAPDLCEAHNNLGIVYYKKGMFNEANAAYRRAIEIDPDFAEGHFNLGVNATRIRKWSEAARHFEQAIRCRGAYVDAHYSLGLAYMMQGDAARAINSLMRAVDLQPAHAAAHFELGNLYQQQRNGRLAEAHYRRAIAARPTHVRAFANLGVLLARSGRLQEAEKQFLEALKLRPSDPTLLQNLRQVRADIAKDK